MLLALIPQNYNYARVDISIYDFSFDNIQPNVKDLLSSTTEKTMGGNPAYSLEGTYTDVIYGQQKVMKIGTIKNGIVS